MSTRKFDLIENESDLYDCKMLLTDIVDSQINYHKVQYLRAWERNHSLSPASKDAKVERLRKLKEDILQFIDESSDNSHPGLSLTIELKMESTQKSKRLMAAS